MSSMVSVHTSTTSQTPTSSGVSPSQIAQSGRPVVLVTIHGTFDGGPELSGPEWWQRDSAFQMELAKRLDLDPARVEIAPFTWKADAAPTPVYGPNSEGGRRQAGIALFEKLSRYEAEGRDYYLLGHSHGGSVIYNALLTSVSRKTPLTRLKAWCTVGTPFLDYQPNPYLHGRLGTMGLTLHATAVGALLFAAALLLMYLFEPTPTWKAINQILGASAFTSYYLPFMVAVSTYGIACLAFLYSVTNWHADWYSAATKQQTAERYADRWLAFWHRDDEAIGALSNVRHVKGEIVQPSFLVPLVSQLPLLLTYVGLAAIFYYFLLDRSPVSADTIAMFTSYKDKIAGAATSGGGFFGDWKQFLMATVVIPASFLMIFLLITGAAVSVIKVIAGWIGYPLSRLINGLVWSSVRQSAWGDDRQRESVVQVGSHPPGFTPKYGPLPKPVGEPLSAYCDSNAHLALSKLRGFLGMSLDPQSYPDFRSDIAKTLTWREMLHCSYFYDPRCVSLMAIGLHRAGLAELKPDFWQTTCPRQVDAWYQAIATAPFEYKDVLPLVMPPDTTRPPANAPVNPPAPAPKIDDPVANRPPVAPHVPETRPPEQFVPQPPVTRIPTPQPPAPQPPVVERPHIDRPRLRPRPTSLRFGPLPVTPAVALSSELALKVLPADQALSLERVNTVPGWNPFLTGNDAAKLAQPLVGPYKRPGEVFQGKGLIPVQHIVKSFVAAQSDAVKAALTPLAEAIPPLSLIRTPAHQFNVAGKPDTRIAFFGGEHPNNQTDINALVAELGAQHMRVMVQWMHISDTDLKHSPQGGLPQDILGNSYMPAGGSHVMAYSTGQRDGKTTIVTSNWGDTSRLDDNCEDLAVHLLAVDYQAGVHDPIPAETLAAYKRNADMWDCFASMIVPFASQEDPFGYQTYTRNPLEVYDQASVRAVAAELANLDWETFNKKFGGFYCAEAQYSIANLGPQEDESGGTLIKKRRFGATRIGKLIETFSQAPGYAGKPIEWCRQNPEIGWSWLLKCGPDNGGISEDQYKRHMRGLATTINRENEPHDSVVKKNYSERQTIFLEFLPESIKGWQSYRTRNAEGLIATPMTMATMVWGLMHQYMPRHGIAQAIYTEFLSADARGDIAVKTAVRAMTGGIDPNSDDGRKALAAASMKMAGGFLLAVLNDKTGLDAADAQQYASKAQYDVFRQAGYHEITNEPDRAKVRAIWDTFMGVLSNPAHTTQELLNAALLEADAQAAAVSVERKTPNGQIVQGLMQFVPPGAWVLWAQQPEFCQSYAVRYAATAIHRKMASAQRPPQTRPDPEVSAVPPAPLPGPSLPLAPETPVVDAAPRPVPQPSPQPEPAPAPEPRERRVRRLDVPLFGPDPVTPAVTLSADMAQRVRRADDALSVATLNATKSWNPFLTGNDDLTVFKGLVGDYQQPSDLFRAKVLIPVKAIMAGTPIAGVMPEVALLRTPAHQFNVDGRTDSRVVFFGGAEPNHQVDVEALVAELGSRHMRVIVEWLHFADRAATRTPQGGLPQHILGNDFLPGGGSHIMAYSTGQRDGKTTLVTSNWGDTSTLADTHSHYAMHLLAIDYQAGVHDPVPDETLCAYKRNADMWDCIASLTVPFSDNDPFGYTSFNWNPLEVHSQATARAVAAGLANLDWDGFSKKYGAFYCAEAQYSIANLGPQEDEAGGTLIKKSRFGQTRLGKLIETYAAAPGYAGKPIEWCRQHPDIGWRWLVECGPDKGGISSKQYRQYKWSLATQVYPGPGEMDGFIRDTYSNRQTVFLEFIPEPIKGWQAYRPKNAEGLIATPMTTATMIWSLMHQYMPRQGVATTILTEILKAHALGDTTTRAAIAGLAGGADPETDAGRTALADLALKLAGGFVLATLTDKTGMSDEEKAMFKSKPQARMFAHAGFHEITNAADKAKVHEIWDRFIAVLSDPANATQERLSAALLAADANAAAVVVERQPPKGPVVKGLMQCAPPGAWAVWAQQPGFCQSYAVRYVATAMHKSLGKAVA